MADSPTRVFFSNNQFLDEDDFRTEQQYHIDGRWRHNRHLHTPGIATGLEVSVGAGNTLEVSEGLAVDSQGRDLDWPGGSISMSTDATQNVTIEWHEVESRTETWANVPRPTRVGESPIVRSSGDPVTADQVVLAVVTLASGGGTPELDFSGRAEAGSREGDVVLPPKPPADTGPVTLTWGDVNRADLLGNLRIAQTAGVGGDLTVEHQLTTVGLRATGAVALAGGLTVTGGTTAQALTATTLTVSGAATLNGGLSVSGATNVAGLTASAAVAAASLTVSGATALSGTLSVAGATNVTGLTASGAVAAASVTAGSATVRTAGAANGTLSVEAPNAAAAGGATLILQDAAGTGRSLALSYRSAASPTLGDVPPAAGLIQTGAQLTQLSLASTGPITFNNASGIERGRISDIGSAVGTKAPDDRLHVGTGAYKLVGGSAQALDGGIGSSYLGFNAGRDRHRLAVHR